MITYAEFKKIEMHVGQIIDVQPFPNANKPAYQLKIDLGAKIGVKRSSAQITNYSSESLMGKSVICVTNFPPKQIADFMSEVLVLGVDSVEGGLSLLEPNLEAQPGVRVY